VTEFPLAEKKDGAFQFENSDIEFNMFLGEIAGKIECDKMSVRFYFSKPKLNSFSKELEFNLYNVNLVFNLDNEQVEEIEIPNESNLYTIFKKELMEYLEDSVQ
jgi:hypothetical protein